MSCPFIVREACKKPWRNSSLRASAGCSGSSVRFLISHCISSVFGTTDRPDRIDFEATCVAAAFKNCLGLNWQNFSKISLIIFGQPLTKCRNASLKVPENPTTKHKMRQIRHILFYRSSSVFPFFPLISVVACRFQPFLRDLVRGWPYLCYFSPSFYLFFHIMLCPARTAQVFPAFFLLAD